jgi:predicted nucleic acid-binding protein
VAAKRIVLDSGALSELGGRRGRVRQYLGRAIESDYEIAVPAIVIAESTTGTSRDSAINHALKAVVLSIISIDESIARAGGHLRFLAGRPTRDTIDAIVVAVGDLSPGSIILTGDAGDVGALAAVRGRSYVVGLNSM